MWARRILPWIASVALVGCVAFFAAGLGAAEKVLRLKDGRQLTGEVTKTADGYVIKMFGGEVTIPADEVLSVEDVKTPQAEFGKRLAETDAKDPEALYGLARWAVDQNLLTEARGVLQKVLALKGDHANAKLLLQVVEIRLASPTTPAEPEPTTKPGEQPPPEAARLLKTEGVYRIRLLELRKDDKVVIEFRDRLLDRFIESMRGVEIFSQPDGERRFRGAPRVDQARYILDNTDRASPFRDDILVKSDPMVMAEFRRQVWPIVAKGCAGASCHGGIKGAGDLWLVSSPSTEDRVVYTNFYLLHNWSHEGRRLLKRDEPDMSLLLQYGLPRQLARLPHPVRIDPVFRSKEDRNYVAVRDWIRSLRFPLPGGYGMQGERQEGSPPTTSTRPSLFD